VAQNNVVDRVRFGVMHDLLRWMTHEHDKAGLDAGFRGSHLKHRELLLVMLARAFDRGLGFDLFGRLGGTCDGQIDNSVAAGAGPNHSVASA